MKRILVLLTCVLTASAEGADSNPAPRPPAPGAPGSRAAPPAPAAPTHPGQVPSMAGQIPGYQGPLPGMEGPVPGQLPKAQAHADVPLTDALLGKYIAYQKKVLSLAGQEMKQRGLLPGQAGAPTGDVTKVNEELDEVARKASDTARRQVSLSEAELDTARAVVSDVMVPRMQWRMGGGERSLPHLRKQADQATGSRREEMLKQIELLEQNMARLRDAKDARQKYGDETVDRVLKREPELRRVQEKALRAGLLRFIQ